MTAHWWLDTDDLGIMTTDNLLNTDNWKHMIGYWWLKTDGWRLNTGDKWLEPDNWGYITEKGDW